MTFASETLEDMNVATVPSGSGLAPDALTGLAADRQAARRRHQAHPPAATPSRAICAIWRRRSLPGGHASSVAEAFIEGAAHCLRAVGNLELGEGAGGEV